MIGILIAIIIVVSTWGLLRDSLRLSLDGVPNGISYECIGEIIDSIPGVKSFHHMHIWALSTTENALTVHVVLECIKDMESIKCILKEKLREAGVNHATLEFESLSCGCHEECVGK